MQLSTQLSRLLVLSASLFLLLIVKSEAQVSDELQDAENQVPVAQTAYPADRDRSSSPELSSPRAYVFAYYNLPYAIDLSMEQDNETGIGFERVIVDFNSVNLSNSEEISQLKNAISRLEQMLDEDQINARRKYVRGMVNSESDMADISAQGNAVIAQRELLCTKDLYFKLSERYNDLEKNSVQEQSNNNSSEISNSTENNTNDNSSQVQSSSSDKGWFKNVYKKIGITGLVIFIYLGIYLIAGLIDFIRNKFF